MLFGSTDNNNTQTQNNGGEINLFAQPAQGSAASSNSNKQSINLLDSLFADITGPVCGMTALHALVS